MNENFINEIKEQVVRREIKVIELKEQVKDIKKEINTLNKTIGQLSHNAVQKVLIDVSEKEGETNV